MSAPLPNAWYALNASLSAARAVSACAMDSLPMGELNDKEVLFGQINHLGDLINGIQLLLEQAASHVNELSKN